jgi:predicted ATPase/DNA-binding CsgD family transcriptional regulator
LVSSAPALASAGVSDREAEVLALLGEHLSHAEIASRLFISVRTVESHVASLRRKLGVAGHRELIQLAASWRAAEAERAPRPPARLPAPLTSFIGRDSERAALAAALGESRLVSMVGPGGIGKTRLALAVAADVAGRFPGGTWYADLVLVAEAAMLPAAVMTAIGLSESSSRPAKDVLAAAVRERRALLVLDNCEHLVNAVAALTERLLSAGPELVVLVTSRIRLVVPHETVYLVPGLSVPPDEPDGGDAVALFAVRAAAAGAVLGAGGDQRRVGGICRTLGGVPLAIELAAARLPSLGLDGLEAGLADQLGLLAGGSRQPARHRSLSDTLEWSHQLLDAREQAVLGRVAVFAAPFTLAAAVAVAGFDPARPTQVADALARLAEHSLLTPVTGAGGTRYQALEPVRQFGTARLDPDDGQQTRVRHLAWCLATAAELDQGETAAPSWCGAFDAAADDLRAALAWSAGQPGTRGEAYQLAVILARLLFTRGRLREAQRRYEQAAPLAAGPASAAAALECAAATAKCRVIGHEALRLDRAAADMWLRAGNRAAASVAFARIAEHINRFIGMYASPPPPGTVETMLADARACAGDDARAAAAISTADEFRRVQGILQAEGGLRDALAAGQALGLARQAGDPLLVSAALDAVTLAQVMRGDIAAAAGNVAERIDPLIPMARDPRAAFDLQDALHTAIFVGVAAGQTASSLRHAEQHRDLEFLREERDLADAGLLAPAALAGQWDRVVAIGDQFRRDWEQAGQPAAPGRALAPAAVAMVHGLRGDDSGRAQWLAILAAIRGVDQEQAQHGCGYGEAFGAIVLLHHGQPDAAMGLLTADEDGSSFWHLPLWHQWITALRAEAAVLAGDAGSAHHLAQAKASADRNPIAAALTQRAEALLRADRAALLAAAAAFAQASYPYQQARTLILAGGGQRAAGEDELARMGAAPMAASWKADPPPGLAGLPAMPA